MELKYAGKEPHEVTWSKMVEQDSQICFKCEVDDGKKLKSKTGMIEDLRLFII
jgi:hypothetical protein